MGPGKIIGAVTQMLTAPLPFIRVNFTVFLCVGLCYRVDLKCRTCGIVRGVGCDREEGDSLIA